ncbi:MAG: alpha/beta fold hydrolase, partial [Candidatus Promineifilaceae bacterium]
MKAEITLGALYFEREGEGRDIYIIHGSPGDARFMRGMLEPVFETKGGWRRTYLELPGFGKSTANKVFDSHDMMLEFVLESVDHLSAGRPYALLGYSYGAYLAQGALIKKSNLLRGLCLIAPRMMQDPSLKTVPERRVIDEDEEFSRDLTEDEAWLSEFVVMQS